MDVFFIPDNKLGVILEKYYNGHVAAITTDTDLLDGGKYMLPELELFRNNITGTIFYTYFSGTDAKAKNFKDTGRVKFGLYFYTDYWSNPITQVFQPIPDYYTTKWTAAGAAIFANAIEGATKISRYPNHGQQMFDISNGAYGYDVINETIGLSLLQELTAWADYQKSRAIAHIGTLTTFSYRNGRNNSPAVYIPHFLGGRNSNADYEGLPYSIQEPELIRLNDIDKPSTCRGWDAWYNSSEFPTIEAAIAHTQMRLQEAINEGGWFTEFIHWHSIYNSRTIPKGVAVDGGDIRSFYKFFKGYDDQIGSQDVWRAGYGEVLEYSYLKGFIDSVGSFQKNGNFYIFYRVKDHLADTFTNGINNNVNESLFGMPVSLRFSTVGTDLEGVDIICNGATLIRKISASEWVVSVPFYARIDQGVGQFKIEAGSSNYYNSARPTITRAGNVFTSDLKSKWVAWRKTTGSGWETTGEIQRDTVFKTSFTVTIEAGYDYYIGAISEFGVSSVLDV